MPDNAAILRVAEAERHRAEIALDAHYDTCEIWPPENCGECCRLARLAADAARQLGLLQWNQARAQEAKARRWRRSKKPAPVITGLRVDPRRQP